MQICVPGVGSKCHFPLPGAFVPPCPRGAETPFPLLPERAGCSSEQGNRQGCVSPDLSPVCSAGFRNYSPPVQVQVSHSFLKGRVLL